MEFMGLGLLILNYVATWQLFAKAGEEGWKALIPFYNEYVISKLSNCVKLFWADLILTIISFSGVMFVVITGFMAAFGSLVGMSTDINYIIYNILGASVFTMIPLIVLSIFIMIAKTVIKVFINLKFVSCYTDETVFKVLAGIGSFSPLFVALVVSRSILAFDEKYTYSAPEK